ncbi:MAG: hypothetical protein JSR93_08855 [Verrucomicrobia bacterium]|nr:hypothetical protein [Verrucomicrobiota bacterium]
MAQTLQSLDSMPNFSGADAFLSVMNRSQIGVEDDELPLPGRPLRVLIRIIFCTITLPFFAAAGAIYNLTVAGSKLFLATTSVIAKNYFEMERPGYYISEGVYHLSITIFDLSIFFVFPLLVAAYAALPNTANRIYYGMNEWLQIKMIGK